MKLLTISDGAYSIRQNVIRHHATDFSDISIMMDVANVWLIGKQA